MGVTASQCVGMELQTTHTPKTRTSTVVPTTKTPTTTVVPTTKTPTDIHTTTTAVCGNNVCEDGEFEQGCIKDCEKKFIDAVCSVAFQNNLCEKKCDHLQNVDSNL